MDLALATGIFESRNFLFLIGGVIALVWIVAASLETIISTRSRERTKREVAAYVAEGSIKPEDAVRILNTEHKKISDYL
ncbi:MAG: hypothetical protein EA376_07860 [Phycisphaeraceae bacterium]|nr:MAG: hypothetical protein EA376_07860 [Phycisphaeraceae bacterium]